MKPFREHELNKQPRVTQSYLYRSIEHCCEQIYIALTLQRQNHHFRFCISSALCERPPDDQLTR